MPDQHHPARPSTERAELYRLLLNAETLARRQNDEALTILIRRAIIRASFVPPVHREH